MQCFQSVGQGSRPRLQYQRRLDLEHVTVTNGRDSVPAWTGSKLFRPEFLTAPRTNDDIGLTAYDFVGIGNDSLGSDRLTGKFRKTVVTARHADQFRDPAYTGNHRVVPFLKIHPRPGRQTGGDGRNSIQVLLQFRAKIMPPSI